MEAEKKSIWKKLGNMLLPENETDFEDEEFEVFSKDEDLDRSIGKKSKRTESTEPGYAEVYPKKDNVVGINQSPGYAQRSTVDIVRPSSQDELERIVQSLKNKSSIVLNLDEMDESSAQRAFDYLKGATYAINGKIENVTKRVYVIVPANVALSKNLRRNVTTYSDESMHVIN